MKFLITPILILFVLCGLAQLTAFAQPNSAIISPPDSISSSSEDLEKEAIELRRNWNRPAMQKALEIYLNLANIKESENQKSLASKYLREAAQIKIILGQAKESLPILQKSLKFAEEAKDFGAKAETEGLLSYTYSFLGDLAKGESEINKALKSVEKTPDLNAKAEVNFYAGEFNYSKQNVEKMLVYFEKSADYFSQINNLEGESKTLVSLAFAYLVKADYLRGKEIAEKALNIAQSLNDKRSMAKAMIVLGRFLNKLGKTQEALPNYLKAEELFPEEIDLTEKAILKYAIGEIYLAYGDCVQATKYVEETLGLLRKDDHENSLGEALNSLGETNFKCGNYDKALHFFNESISISSNQQTIDTLASAKIKIAEIYKAKGEFKESLKNYQRIAGLNNVQIHNRAKINFGLGDLFEKQGDLKAAKVNYLKSLELNRQIKYRFEEANLLYRLAKIEGAENNSGAAFRNIEQAIEITENLSSEVSHSKLKSIYFSSVFERYEFYIGLLMSEYRRTGNADFAVKALQAAEKSRARSMLESLSLAEADFTKDANPETVKREKEIRRLLNLKSDELSNLLSRNAEKGEVEKSAGEIREIENELAEINANLKQNSPLYAAIKNPAPFDIGEFQRDILDENTLLLEFSFGNEASFLWLIGKTGFASYELPPREQIEPKIIKLRELTASREMKQGETVEDYQSRIFEAEKLYWLAAHELSRELFGQIGDKIAGKRLLIVPDGKLHYFPVSALPFPNSGKDEPFILSNEIVYEPSAATLSLLSKQHHSGVSKNLLVFSDPIFTNDDARLKPENAVTIIQAGENPPSLRFVESLESLQRLAASKDEANLPLKFFGAANSDSFSGFAANRENFLNAKIGDYKILHFATHSFLNEERPELSGIVLSGFDEKGNKLNQLLRLQDIYGLNLNCEMVVLSSCNSGIGKEMKGEGLQSLNNAFLQVGAKTVISSVWKVDDYATLELMQHFYQTLADNNATPAAALRQAQIKMWQSKRYNSPFYWAAFTAQGDFRHKTTLTKTFDTRIYWAIPILAILFFVIWRFWGKRRQSQSQSAVGSKSLFKY